MNEKEPIGVIGVGWVGLVTAACLAELGHDVWAREILADKVESLSRGEVPIHEPGLPEIVSRNEARLRFTTDMTPVLEHARLLFVCVDTPPTYSGDADLSRVDAVVAELGDSNDHALVMKSTVPVGTGRAIRRRRDGLGYVANPEFLKEGSAVDDFMNPDRVVIGADDGSTGFADRVEALYGPLDGELVRTDVASAEMIKLASNAFLATKISFINEIANVSEELGADVTKVAEGMGLDDRIGPKFLRAGIGWGGSCLDGKETVLVRHHGRTILLCLERLWRRLDEDDGEVADGIIEPGALEVLCWIPGSDAPSFLPVMLVTRREFEGELIEVRTKMGRRVRCTPDHPWVVGAGGADTTEIKLADELSIDDWLPLAQGREEGADPAALLPLDSAVEAAGLRRGQVAVRPPAAQVAQVVGRATEDRRVIFSTSRSAESRTREVQRTATLRLDEFERAELSLRGAGLATAGGRTFVKSEITTDSAFWRVAGLYIAEGHCHLDNRPPEPGYRLSWTFHPRNEQHLVDEVVAFWLRHGVEAKVYDTPTSKHVTVSSRLLGLWWTRVLGLGRTSYEQRLPDLIWDRPDENKWALLSGLWEGDGSWSPVGGGPSVVVELGTVSDELADGVLRLLGDLRVVASWRTARTAKSTKDTHWLTISGANQVERAIALVPERDRSRVRAFIARQRKRIAPTGYRRFESGQAWARVVSLDRRPYSGPVYSLEVPGAHTFVTTGGVVTDNCFGKDVLSLRQLAANTGYHFQLLTAVTEVNDLQKRRTIGKLQKHLGSLVGKTVALLGISFKPDTDDIRDATSLMLAGRLIGEGARVRAYDPVAMDRAREVLSGTEFSDSALDAIDGADAAVLVTEWPEFAELDWAEVKRLMRVPLIVDGRNFLDREALVEAGFTYEGIGR